MSEKREKLFADFPKTPTQEWEDIIIKDLKGADYAKKLLWKTNENFIIKPYYREEDLNNLEYLLQIPGEFPFVRGTKENGNDWKITQLITESDLKKANTIAVHAVKKGANALILNAKELNNINDLSAILENIDLNTISVRFENHVSYPNLAKLFLHYIEEKKYDKKRIQGSFNYDPITYMLQHNSFWKSKEDDLAEILALHQSIGKELLHFQYITINGNILHNCGTNIIQELAYALAAANEYLAYASDNKINIEEIAPYINFTFSIGSNYFMEIAKLRSARLLWATIVEQYQPEIAETAKMHITSFSSMWNKTTYDAHVNMLRATTEGMSAAIGGADAIVLNPYDESFRPSDDFSRRIARNTQIILKEEAHFDKINDPAAGSYYIENLSNSLSEEVWKLFCDIEKKGGIIQCGLNGSIKEAVDESCRKRDMDIATRRMILLGTNQYPNTNEQMLDKIKSIDTPQYKGLQPYRAALAFEKMRLATETYAQSNPRPKVFLLKIGNLAMRQARAGFITNFFGCIGYEIIETQGYKTPAEGVKDALNSKANIVAICSSDEEYLDFASEITQIIKKQNPAVLCIVAGNPVEIIESLKAAGVDDFIHIKLNVLETLRRYNQLLGI